MLNKDLVDPKSPKENNCKFVPSPRIPEFTQGVRQKEWLRAFVVTNVKYE